MLYFQGFCIQHSLLLLIPDHHDIVLWFVQRSLLLLIPDHHWFSSSIWFHKFVGLDPTNLWGRIDQNILPFLSMLLKHNSIVMVVWLDWSVRTKKTKIPQATKRPRMLLKRSKTIQTEFHVGFYGRRVNNVFLQKTNHIFLKKTGQNKTKIPRKLKQCH